MEKLVVVIMGQNCQKFIGMCLESVKDADALYYLDGGSTDNTLNIAQEFLINHPNIKPAQIDIRNYDQEDRGMNGKQRNYYLNYLKTAYNGFFKDWWCLVLDADEVVEDLSKYKKFIQQLELQQPQYKDALYSPDMRHFIGDLGHEDSAVPKHFVLHRLFRIRDGLFYPELEHPVLNADPKPNSIPINVSTIWHLAYCPNMWDIKKRYENHMKKSDMHTPEYLRKWYYGHLFGFYPKTEIKWTDIPEVILKEFGIDKDEFYFMDRDLETKHFVMARQWVGYMPHLKNCIEFGCGKAPYGFALSTYGMDYKGIELSKWAVEHAFIPIEQGNLLNYKGEPKDLAIAFDVLEHIDYEDLFRAIENIKSHAKKMILVSVPVLGDPNLDGDKTHKIRETKEWWIKQFTDQGLKYVSPPEFFLFKEQIMLFEVNTIQGEISSAGGVVK